MDKEPKTLDDEIDRVIEFMSTFPPNSKSYKKSAEALRTLYDCRSKPSANRVDANTLALVSANLIGLVMLVKHEQFNVITSRITGFIVKPK